MEEILVKYLQGRLSESETQQLEAWLEASADNRKLFEQLKDGRWVSGQLQKVDGYNAEGKWQELKTFFPAAGIGTVRLSRTKFWLRMAVAASVVLAVSIGAYFTFFQKDPPKAIIVQQPSDIEAPVVTKATITLSDGRRVTIDSLTSLTQSSVELKKTADGQLIYSGNTKEALYNTLTNPKGSPVAYVALADGSQVWLNAGSSIRYPVAFTGKDREVTITGEAYFEVAHDASKPFYVSKDDVRVQVLGTHFNVNTYDDEPDMRVTLLEGSVRVSKGSATTILQPGQQAKVNSTIQVLNGVNLDEVMAWKNGRFHFDGSNAEMIMREVSRWYNVDVEFKDKIPHLFVVKVSRDVPVSQLLKAMETTTRIHFERQGNKIIVRK